MAIMESEEIVLELRETLCKVPETQVDAFIRMLRSHARLFVYAAGRSGLMIKAFAVRLVQMGFTAYVVGETATPSLQKGDLLILASASGTTKSVCEYADTAKKIGADTAVITTDTPSYLRENFDPVILMTADSKLTVEQKSVQPMGSLFEQALLLILDTTIMRMTAHRVGKYDEMRRNHVNLE